MKKLRFLGIVLGVMVMWAGNIVGKVYAYDCVQNYSWKWDGYRLVEDYDNPIYLNHGESVCVLGSFYNDLERANNTYSRVFACPESGSEFVKTDCAHTGEKCITEGKTASCKSTTAKKCKTTIDGGVVDNVDPGRYVCISGTNKYGVCDGSTGVVNETGNCGDGKYCETVYNTAAFSDLGYSYKCLTSQCSKTDGGKTFTAKKGEGECITDNGQWFKAICNGGNFEWQSSDFCQNGCVESIENQPKCLESGEVMCTKINSQIINKQGSDGDKVCDGSSIYECQKDKAPEYQFLKDCSTEKTGDGKSKVCGVIDSKVGCYSEEQVQESGENQSFVQIDMVSDSGFFCDGNNGIQTALGCIPYSMSGLAGKLLPLLFGIAGGISFLLMVFGFIMVATSSGDEKKLIEARGRITSAITGLLVSIFAIFLFRLIFSNILKIPGL